MGHFGLQRGQSVSCYALVNVNGGKRFFKFSRASCFVLHSFPTAGDQRRDMMTKARSNLRMIIGDMYKNDDAAVRRIIFSMIGGNFEASFKAVTDIVLNGSSWSFTFAHL